MLRMCRRNRKQGETAERNHITLYITKLVYVWWYVYWWYMTKKTKRKKHEASIGMRSSETEEEGQKK